MQKLTYIKDIHFLNSNASSLENLQQMYFDGIFSKPVLSKGLTTKIEGLFDNIKSPLKRRMSQLSLGVFQALQNGGAKNIREEDEIYLFSSFAEIETSSKIISDLELNQSTLVSPMLFHNSVHNTPLGYYTIINKINNYCLAISDGINTNKSFVDMINMLTKVNNEFIIVSGDEYSDFYNLDFKYELNLFPTFISYKLSSSNENKGFYPKLLWKSYDELEALLLASNYDYIITSKNSFNRLENKVESKLITDYPICADFPIAISVRLALPFILNLSGKTAVIEENNDKFFLFEVLL